MHFTTLFSHWRMGDVANPPFSQIVYHFSTLRRSEPYSGGIGLIKSTVKPFLARGWTKARFSGLCYQTKRAVVQGNFYIQYNFLQLWETQCSVA